MPKFTMPSELHDPTAADALKAWIMIEAIRADEGHCITISCDNPDFNEQPNSAVDVVADFTAWRIQRFTGDTVYAAIEAAYAAMMAYKEVVRKRVARNDKDQT